ncbi:MAG: hypothetical protein NT120_01080 [Candidatus Aenigmarchaeota archaeon]|nr:hypothetical protein [Candidatus Aenigmarchaeota archaeon]
MRIGGIPNFLRSVFLVGGIINLIVDLIIFVVILIFLIKFNAPWEIFLIVILGFAIAISFSILRIYRLKSLDLSVREIPKRVDAMQPTDKSEAAFEPQSNVGGEKIIGAIYGILYGGWKTNVQVMGVGGMSHPENSMFITNKRVIFVCVPVPGGGRSLGRMDFTKMNVAINNEYIEEEGKRMIENMTPQQILEFDKNNYDIPLNKIKEINSGLFKAGINFVTTDGKKFRFLVRKKEQMTELKLIFAKYLPQILVKI